MTQGHEILFWRRLMCVCVGWVGFAAGGPVQIRGKSPFIRTVSSVWREVGAWVG